MKWTPKTWKSHVQTIQWNPSQQAVMEAALETNENIILEACAGSGKTTLLTSIVARLPASKITPEGKKEYRVLFCAFNRHNIDEITNSGKLPKRVQARTAHQVAKGLLTRYLKAKNPDWTLKVDSEDQICRNICSATALRFNEVYEEYQKDKDEDYAPLIYQYPVETITELEIPLMAKYLFRLTEQFRQVLFAISEEEIERESLKTSLIPDDLILNKGHYTAIKILLKSILTDLEYKFKYEQICSFNSMLWLVEELAIEPFYKDLLIIDEAQDSNPSQQKLYEKFAERGSRVIGVGDPNQSIWSFCGSTPEAWETFKQRFKGKFMVLEETYRCSQKVAELANHFKPIQAKTSNPKGLVKTIAPEKIQTYLGSDNLILSRFNAPLIKWSLLLTREGISNEIKGIEISQKIISYIEKFSNNNYFDYEECDQKTKAKLRELKENNKHQEAEQIKDIYLAVQSCYETLYPEASSVKQWLMKIEQLFKDKNENQIVRLSTIHRSKGDESENVFLLGSNQLPYHHNEEENNLIYVAITRSKLNLYLIPTKEENSSQCEPSHLSDDLGGLQLQKVSWEH